MASPRPPEGTRLWGTDSTVLASVYGPAGVVEPMVNDLSTFCQQMLIGLVPVSYILVALPYVLLVRV